MNHVNVLLLIGLCSACATVQRSAPLESSQPAPEQAAVATAALPSTSTTGLASLYLSNGYLWAKFRQTQFALHLGYRWPIAEAPATLHFALPATMEPMGHLTLPSNP